MTCPSCQAETKVGRVDDVTLIQSTCVHWIFMSRAFMLASLSLQFHGPRSPFDYEQCTYEQAKRYQASPWLIKHGQRCWEHSQGQGDELCPGEPWVYLLLPSGKSWGMQVPARCSTSCSLQSCTSPLEEHFPHIKHSMSVDPPVIVLHEALVLTL